METAGALERKAKKVDNSTFSNFLIAATAATIQNSKFKMHQNGRPTAKWNEKSRLKEGCMMG